MDQKQIYNELTALKGLIREVKSSYRGLAKAIGISVNSLFLRMNGFYAFNTVEIMKIVNELDIAPEEVLKYFFPSLYKQDRKCITAPSYIK